MRKLCGANGPYLSTAIKLSSYQKSMTEREKNKSNDCISPFAFGGDICYIGTAVDVNKRLLPC